MRRSFVSAVTAALSSMTLLCGLAFAQTDTTPTTPAVDPATPPAVADCLPTDGLGDVCKLPDKACSCNNVCGQSLFNDPQVINHYCYGECDPLADTPIECPSADDACVPIDPNMTQFMCMAMGKITTGFQAKLLEEGAEPDPMGSDHSLLSNVTAGLGEETFPLQAAIGQTMTVEDKTYVILVFQGFDAQKGLWLLQLEIPLEKFLPNTTLQLNNEVQDFGGSLMMGKVDGQQISNVYLKGFVAQGTLNLVDAPLPGDEVKASGNLDLDILGFTAELAMN